MSDQIFGYRDSRRRILFAILFQGSDKIPRIFGLSLCGVAAVRLTFTEL